MSKPSPSAYSDKDYQARDDARHLIETTKVHSDPKRHKAAQKAVDDMAKEANETILHAKAAKGLKRAFKGGN